MPSLALGPRTRLWLVAIAWLGFARLAADYAVLLLPGDFVRALGLHGYLGIVLFTSTAFGLALSRLLLDRPTTLGLTPTSPRALAVAALAAPVVLALSAYLAFRLALPTLIAEITEGGRQAAERNTGAFGRALVASHPLLTVTWAVILTPLAEEILFRGALYEAVARTARREHARRAIARLREHVPAVVVTSIVFASMHADQAGGAGIVRVAQAASLGAALAVARGLSGSVLPAMLLHALFNLMTIAKVRGWVVSPVWPHPLPIALWWWQLAAGASALLALMALHAWPSARTIEVVGEVHLSRGEGASEAVSPAPPRWLVAEHELSWRREPEGDGVALGYTLRWQLRSALLRPLATRLAQRRARALRRTILGA